MNLKEFDAKQFLLEKGEQVGLGIALTIMVLMLIFSLFMPSQGFFSGSPAAMAEPLTKGTEKLERDLRSRPLPDKYKPADTKGRLIDLDTDPLQPYLYRMTGSLFEPAAPENPNRQPPEIFNLVEAKGVGIHVGIDTYIFNKGNDKIYILREQGQKGGSNNGGGGKNSFANYMKGGMAGMSGGAGGGPGNMQAMQAAMRRFSGPNAASQNVQGADSKEDYEVVPVPLEKVTMSEHFARQLQPARMALIVGAFPYKRQLEEFKTKLRRESIQDVLDESMQVETKDGKKEELGSFRFLGVDVERMEVDVAGQTVKPWAKLDMDATYRVWLINSIHFERDDPKYDVVKPMDGLVMPLLREFREKSQQSQMKTMIPGMMSGAPGGFGPAGANEDEPEKPKDSKYPDLAKELSTINDTLTQLQDITPKQIAKPPEKFRIRENFNAFGGSTPSPADNPQDRNAQQAKPGDKIPEYCLVRLVDLGIQPGKFYRYRFKVRMANPNYGRDDVASTAYKAKLELESNKWWELKDTVSIPPETIYYVVDQKLVSGKEKFPVESPQADMWNQFKEPTPRDHYVCLQLHRWVESTRVDVKNDEAVPIGEWAIADRVFVARGEFVGQTVKVDLPVWKYSQDSFVLPAEDQKARKRGKVRSGVSVNFGLDNSDTQTILVDFEGGKDGIRSAKLDDISAIEVLMLSPDGKLRARNSSDDATDKDRQDRREKVQQRIQEVREGKAAGAGAAGGLDTKRGK